MDFDRVKKTGLDEACDDFIALIERKKSRSSRSLSSNQQWAEFDKQIGGGFDAGTLVTVAGRTGSGKSAFVGDLIESFRIGERNLVLKPYILHFSLEMSTNQLLLRFVQKDTGYSVDKIRSIGKNVLTDDEFRDIQNSIIKWRNTDKGEEYEDHGIKKRRASSRGIDYFTESMDVGELYAIVEDYQDNPRFEGYFIVVVIDHVLLLSSMGDIRHMILDLEKALIQLRKKKQTLIIQIAQMNRGIEYAQKSKSRRPMLSDIAESDAIAHASDLVLFIDRPEQRGIQFIGEAKASQDDVKNGDAYGDYLSSKGKLLVHVMKNRDGHCGSYLFKHNFSQMEIKFLKTLNTW